MNYEKSDFYKAHLDTLTTSRLSQRCADWDKIRARGVEITVFRDTIHNFRALVERLEPCTCYQYHPDLQIHGRGETITDLYGYTLLIVDIICTMRERTPFPPELLKHLPNLKLLTTNGGRNRSLPSSTRELPVLTTTALPPDQTSGGATNEHCWALILSACKNVVDGNNRIQLHEAGRKAQVPWQGSLSMGLG